MPDSSTQPPVSQLSSYQMNDSVGYLMSRVKSVMTNLVTQRTQEELGITGTQASMLFMIAVGKCSTAAELAREYGIDASAVTRLLDRVENAACCPACAASRIGVSCASS